MRTTLRTRGGSVRLIVPVAFLLLALGLAQALQAERSHRAVVERTLWDYADFAAFILGSRVYEVVQPQIDQDLDLLRRVAIGDTADVVAEALLQPCVDGGSAGGSAPRWAFHLNFAANTFETWGPAPETARAWTQDTLWADVRRDEVARFSFSHLFGQTGGERVALVYTAQRDAWEEPVRAYGLTPCFERAGRSAFQWSLSGPPALPPTLTATLPNDSLLSVRVLDPSDRIVWQSPVQFEHRFLGRSGVWGPFGGLTLETALRPELADQLVIGGMPRSRLPLTLGLLALASILVLTALFQLRRGYELVRLREGFVSSVSHELRTPLQQVLLFVELLRMKKLRTEHEKTRSLEIVEEETRRLIQLVENLLQFSRAGRGEVTVDPRRIDLAEVVGETVEAFQPLARAGKASVRCDLEPVLAVADPDAVRRIVLNLLDNAVKYGPDGQTIEVATRSRNGSAVLQVDDQGPGVPPEDRARIWEPYYRARRLSASDDTGSGIGLSIVRELVALQHGEVGVQDRSGGGASFVVSLPAARSPEPGAST